MLKKSREIIASGVKVDIRAKAKYRVMNSHFLCYNISDSAVSKVFLAMSKKVAIGTLVRAETYRYRSRRVGEEL